MKVKCECCKKKFPKEKTEKLNFHLSDPDTNRPGTVIRKPTVCTYCAESCLFKTKVILIHDG